MDNYLKDKFQPHPCRILRLVCPHCDKKIVKGLDTETFEIEDLANPIVAGDEGDGIDRSRHWGPGWRPTN